MESFVFLLEQTQDFEIGEGVVIEIILSCPQPGEQLELLISRGVEIEVTENILKAAAQ